MRFGLSMKSGFDPAAIRLRGAFALRAMRH
jgi:hypothetical protein